MERAYLGCLHWDLTGTKNNPTSQVPVVQGVLCMADDFQLGAHSPSPTTRNPNASGGVQTLSHLCGGNLREGLLLRDTSWHLGDSMRHLPAVHQ